MNDSYDLEAIIHDINSGFIVKDQGKVLDETLFWEFAAVHCDATEFPSALAINMLIILKVISEKKMVSESLKLKLSTFLFSLDLCRDSIVEDVSIDVDLKLDYMLNEMRVARRTECLRAIYICSELTSKQIGYVLNWLMFIKQCDSLAYWVPESLITCWGTFYQNMIPPFSAFRDKFSDQGERLLK